jgi:hypothetical protein
MKTKCLFSSLVSCSLTCAAIGNSLILHWIISPWSGLAGQFGAAVVRLFCCSAMSVVAARTQCACGCVGQGCSLVLWFRV